MSDQSTTTTLPRANGCWRTGTCACLALIALLPAALLYEYRNAPAVSDDLYFTETTFSASPAALLSGAGWEHHVAIGVRGYRPVVLLSYWFNASLSGGGSIVVYRLFNYAVHSVAVVLVGLLALRLSRSRTVALVAALLFAVHPVHHENVIWVSGRTHSLAAVFAVAALVLATTKWGTFTRAGIASLAAAVGLALGSYEAMVTLPLGILLILCLPPRQVVDSGLRIVVALALVAAAYFALRWSSVSGLTRDASAYTFDQVLWNAAGLGGRLLAIPRLDGIPVFSSPVFLATTALVVPALAAGVASSRSRRAVLVGLGLVILFYLPFLGLPGYSDRFTYLSSAGFAVAIAAGSRALWRRVPGPAARASVAVLLVATAVLWCVQLRLAGAQWQEAGQVAHRILQESKRHLPHPADGATVHYFCVPDRLGAAHVFITYFGYAIRSLYDPRDIRGLHHPPAPTLTWTAADALIAPDDHAFRWNPGASRLESWPAARSKARDVRGQVCPATPPRLAP